MSIVIRQSLLKKYHSCPLQARFFLDGVKPDNLSMLAFIGIGVHYAIEQWRTGKCTDKDITKVAQKKINDQVKATDIPINRSDSADKKLEELPVVLQEFVKDNKGQKAFACEIPFKVSIAGIECEGIIDELCFLKQGDFAVNLIDYKTDAVEPKGKYLECDVQFSLYQIAVQEGLLFLDNEWKKCPYVLADVYWYQIWNLVPYKKKVTKGGKTYMAGEYRGERKIPAKRSPTELMISKMEIAQMAKDIMDPTRFFYRTSRKFMACDICSYEKHCSSYNPF